MEPARATDDLAILPALEYVDAARISLEAVFCVEDDAILVSCVLALDCATFTTFFLQRILQKNRLKKTLKSMNNLIRIDFNIKNR